MSNQKVKVRHELVKARRRGSSRRFLDYVKLKQALENPNFKFRTVSGIAKETGLRAEDVLEFVRRYPSDVVVLRRKGVNGEILLTTREHYRKSASLPEKLMGALINRVW